MQQETGAHETEEATPRSINQWAPPDKQERAPFRLKSRQHKQAPGEHTLPAMSPTAARPTVPYSAVSAHLELVDHAHGGAATAAHGSAAATSATSTCAHASES